MARLHFSAQTVVLSPTPPMALFSHLNGICESFNANKHCGASFNAEFDNFTHVSEGSIILGGEARSYLSQEKIGTNHDGSDDVMRNELYQLEQLLVDPRANQFSRAKMRNRFLWKTAKSTNANFRKL